MDEKKLRDQAARPTLERIRADAERASPRLRVFLATIERRLFEKHFNVAALWRDHKIRNNGGASAFSQLGTTPAKYICDARMDTAARLVVDTRLRLWRIAALVGVSQRTLGRRFPERHGQTPEAYRNHGSGIPGETRESFADKVVHGIHGRLVTPGGDALVSTVRGVLDKLLGFYPGEEAPAPRRVVSGEQFERFQAAEWLWPELAEVLPPFAAQRRLIRQFQGLSTPAVYELLHRKSREEGRKDRQRGIELAQLALDSLEANARSLGPHYPILLPQGWAWLGNARRLALDFSGADEALAAAGGALAETADPFATGIVYLCKGTLRTFQRRYDEAGQDFDVALPRFEETGEDAWQITTLIHRAAALGYEDKLDLALGTLLKASSFPQDCIGPFAFDLYCDIATAFVRLDRFADAATYLDSARSAQDQNISGWRLGWLKAAIHKGLGRLDPAEKEYLATAQFLESHDEGLYRSLLLLDLAVMYAEQERLAEVSTICASIQPVFQALTLYDETLASVQLLGHALSEGSLTAGVLSDVRAVLHRDPLTLAL